MEAKHFMETKYSMEEKCSTEEKYSAEERFRAEKLYYIALSVAKSMWEKGVIDKEVLDVIESELLEKYRPVSAALLAGKSLA